ncbi:MAG TPA: hypothetical protein VM165_00835 [Planctomycetaceae bacterium]|nr:hypothetical protein [Planctomycetaceae bacterium]
MLRSVGFVIRDPSQPIPAQGRHLILGLASYSQHDLQLLDDLAQAMMLLTADGQRLAVFDVQQCHDQRDVARFMPDGLGDIWGTPVLGIWENGNFQQRVNGVTGCRQTLQQEGLL